MTPTARQNRKFPTPPRQNSYPILPNFLQIAGRFSDCSASGRVRDWQRVVGKSWRKPTDTPPVELLWVRSAQQMLLHSPKCLIGMVSELLPIRPREDKSEIFPHVIAKKASIPVAVVLTRVVECPWGKLFLGIQHEQPSHDRGLIYSFSFVRRSKRADILRIL